MTAKKSIPGSVHSENHLERLKASYTAFGYCWMLGVFQINIHISCQNLPYTPANPLPPDESMDTLSGQVNLTSQRLETATQTLGWIERVQRGPSRQFVTRLKIIQELHPIVIRDQPI